MVNNIVKLNFQYDTKELELTMIAIESLLFNIGNPIAINDIACLSNQLLSKLLDKLISGQID